jgi:hypothetical protein
VHARQQGEEDGQCRLTGSLGVALNADGLAEFGAYLLAPDRVPLELLHALPWHPILQLLAPAAEVPVEPLDESGQLWATQLTLVALQALVLLPSDHLPGWLISLVDTECLGSTHAQLRASAPPPGAC